MNVAQLVAMGNKVKICHLRTGIGQFELTGAMYTKKQWQQFGCAGVGNLGGQTIVKVETPSGQVLVGEARCSDKDNFCKKLGIQIALGRAMTSGE